MKSRICGIGTKILRLVSDESGQSLVLALVIVLALSVSTAGVITYMTSNETSFSRDRDETRALAIAEAGLQNGIAVLSQYDDDLSVTLNTRVPATGSTSYSVDAGTGSWWAKKTQQSDGSAGSYAKWQITATAKSPDGRVSRTVQESARALPPIQSILPLFNYALYVGGCSQNCPPFNVNNLCKNGDITDNTSVGGSFTATGNFWVGNSLCLSGGAKVSLNANNAYTLYVGGAVQASNNSGVGDSTKKLAIASIVNGCYDSATKPVTCSTSASSNIYSTTWNLGSSAVQTSIKPPIDWTVYTAADWKAPTCTGTPPTFEAAGDSVSNPVPSTSKTLTANDYNCTFSDGGSFVGSLQYVSATKMLTVSGKVFINGNLDMTSTPGFRYQGNGTIYVNGTVTNKNDVCGYPTTTTSTNCATTGGTWDQNQANIEIVAMNAGNCPSTMTTTCTATGWTVNGSGEYDGIAWVNGAVVSTGNGSTTNFKGPVITDFVDKMTGGGGLYYPSAPPSGSEGVTQTPQPYGIDPGSWRQLTN